MRCPPTSGFRAVLPPGPEELKGGKVDGRRWKYQQCISRPKVIEGRMDGRTYERTYGLVAQCS